MTNKLYNLEAATNLVASMISRGSLKIGLGLSEEKKLDKAFSHVVYFMNKFDEFENQRLQPETCIRSGDIENPVQEVLLVKNEPDLGIKLKKNITYYYLNEEGEYEEIEIRYSKFQSMGISYNSCVSPETTIPVRSAYDNGIDFKIKAKELLTEIPKRGPSNKEDVSQSSDANYVFVIDEDKCLVKKLEKEKEYFLRIEKIPIGMYIPSEPVTIKILNFHTELFYVPSSHIISVEDNQKVIFSVHASDILLEPPTVLSDHNKGHEFKYGDIVWMPNPHPFSAPYLKVRIAETGEIGDLLRVRNSLGEIFYARKSDLTRRDPYLDTENEKKPTFQKDNPVKIAYVYQGMQPTKTNATLLELGKKYYTRAENHPDYEYREDFLSLEILDFQISTGDLIPVTHGVTVRTDAKGSYEEEVFQIPAGNILLEKPTPFRKKKVPLTREEKVPFTDRPLKEKIIWDVGYLCYVLDESLPFNDQGFPRYLESIVIETYPETARALILTSQNQRLQVSYSHLKRKSDLEEGRIISCVVSLITTAAMEELAREQEGKSS